MKTKVLCPVPFNHCIVSTNGNIRCCCYQGEQNSMGNLNNNTFDEIWNGERFQIIRQQMIEMEYPDICKCRETTGNTGLGTEPPDGWFIGEDNLIEDLHIEENKNNILKIGAFYYIWYDSGKKWFDLCARKKLNNPQYPCLGEYDSLDENVISNHIDWANEAGIDFFIVCITKDLIENKTFEKFISVYKKVCNNKDNFPKISIQIETLSYFHNQFQASFENLYELKDHINYLKVNYDNDFSFINRNGEINIFIYVSREILNIDFFMHFIKSILPNAYFLCDEVFYGEPKVDRIGNFDAIYGYNMYLEKTDYNGTNNKDGKIGLDFLNMTKKTIDDFKNICSKCNVEFIPSVIPRYNDRGVRLDQNHYVIPEENGNFLKKYLNFVKPYINDMLLITSFNEWYEDTQIEPCGTLKEYGDTCNEPFEITEGHEHKSYYKDYLNIIKEFKNKFNNDIHDEDVFKGFEGERKQVIEYPEDESEEDKIKRIFG